MVHWYVLCYSHQTILVSQRTDLTVSHRENFIYKLCIYFALSPFILVFETFTQRVLIIFAIYTSILPRFSVTHSLPSNLVSSHIFKKSWCCPYTLSCVTFPWSMVNPPWATPLKNNFPSQRSFTTADNTLARMGTWHSLSLFSVLHVDIWFGLS